MYTMYYAFNIPLPLHHLPCTTATVYFLCPPASEVITEGSPCPSECNEDRDCQINSGSNDTLCCPSTTCGQQCVTVQPVPFHSPAFGCPELSDDVIGACVEDCNSCSSDELCCSNGCGHTCMTPVQLTPICRGIVESRGDSVMPGEYVPQCSEDGNFAPVQCHGSTGYCWCVRPDTGEPVGESMTRSQQPQCNSECIVLRVNLSECIFRCLLCVPHVWV